MTEKLQTPIFTFGSQYLRGYSPDRTQWAKDMALMKSLNFNTIRVWLVWGVLEPEDGVIDFDTIDTVLAHAEANSLRVIFLFHLHGAPEWAISKYKDCWYVDQHGQPFEPSARANTPSGGWPGLCPDNPLVQHLERRFIGAVCRHVGSRAYAYEPINEPHMWLNFTQNPNGYFCFCDESRKLFRKWLMNKYTTLQALNDAWGMRYSNWDDVRPPTWHFGYAATVDWRIFTTENIAALVQRRAQVIRENAPGVPVIAHSWGGGTLTCHQLGGMAFDDWKNSQHMDMWGCSAFPSQLSQACNIGLSMDGTRSAANGKEFWQSELSAGDTSGGFNRNPAPTPEIFSIWCWEAIGHGSHGLLFWQFRKELYGQESGAYGLTDYDGTPTPRALAASRISKVLNDNANLFSNATIPKPQVALLFSYSSFMLNWTERRNNAESCNALAGYYRAFWENNISVDILHEEFTTPEALAAYKLLILPAPFTLPSRITDMLPEYVSNGGTILSDPMLAEWDEHQRLASHVPGSNLHKLFGCEEASIVSHPKASFAMSYKDKKVQLQGTPFRASWRCTPNAECLATYDDNSPAIVANAFGNGKAIIAGVNLGHMYSQQSSISDDLHLQTVDSTTQDAAQIILDIADACGIHSDFQTDSSLRVRHMQAQGKDILIIYEYARKTVECDFQFALAGNKRWVNLLDKAEGAFQNNCTRLAFTPNETKVLLLEP